MHIQLFWERVELKTLFGIKLSESTWKPPQVFSISCTNVIHYTHLKHRSCDWINSHSVPGKQYHLNIASSVITGCGSIKNLTSKNSAGPPNRQHVCHCHKINKHFASKNLVLTTFICVLSYLSWCKLFRTAILNWVSKGLPSTNVGEGFVTYCECVNPSKGVRMKPKLLELCRTEVDVNDSHKTGQRSVLYNSHLGQNHPYRIRYWRYDLTKSVYLCVRVCVGVWERGRETERQRDRAGVTLFNGVCVFKTNSYRPKPVFWGGGFIVCFFRPPINIHLMCPSTNFSVPCRC